MMFSSLAYNSLHLLEQAISKGIDPGTASWLISSMGVGSFIGRVGMGLICDTVTRRLGEDQVVHTIIIGNIINGLGKKQKFELNHHTPEMFQP